MIRTADGIVVRSSVRVPLDVADAFRVFTERIGEWWPLDAYSVYTDEAAAVIVEPGVGGRVLETSNGGETSEWGVLTAWEPPGRLAMTWHPGQDASQATAVDVRFTAADGGGTHVELVHTGWEVRGERAAEMAAGYGPGWEEVLGGYAQACR